MDQDHVERLAATFRVLADPARLRILGALAERPHSGRELSERLKLTPPTISHHMARLTGLGIVAVTPEAQTRHYRLDLDALRQVSLPPTAAAPGSDERSDDADRERAKILRDFFVDEKLTHIPAQRKKRVVVLEHLLPQFAPNRDYTEREVNDLLRPAHADVATLRRELVDYGFLNRARGIYRVATSLPARGPTVAQEVRANELAWLESVITGATRRALVDPGQTPPRTPPGPPPQTPGSSPDP